MKFKAWKVIVLIFIFLIAIILTFGPMIAVNQLEKNSKEWVGRKLVIGDFSLNYFTGTVKVNSFVLYEEDDKTPFVAFDSLIINAEPYQYFFNKLVIEEVGLVGLRTYIHQQDTIFNFDDLIAFYSAENDTLAIEQEPVDSNENEDPIVIEVSNIHLNAKELLYNDLELNHESKMVNLNMRIPYISWNAEGGSHAGLHFDLADNGHFGIDFDFNPDSSDFHADIRIQNLNLSSYYVYAEQEMNISSLKGLLSIHLMMDGNLEEVEKTLVAGDMNLKGFEIDDLNKQKIFAIDDLDVSVSKIDYFNQRYIIDSVNIKRAFVNVELFNEGTNFDRLLKESEDSLVSAEIIVEDTVPKSQELYYSLSSFVIDDAAIEFVDHTTTRLFKYHLSAINMSTKNITSDAEWVTTYLDMLLNKRGKMKMEFGFNPMKPMDMDVDYVLTNFQLSDINIYSEMNTGYPFIYGEMFYYSNTKIRDGQIVSENKLRINDVELGDKVKGWKSIPIKFALFLLKDKNGDVVLDVPVRGDLNDPELNIKKLAWTTLKKTIVKVASAPVDFLAGFAKIDPKDIKTIEFAYMDTVLTSHVQHQLNMLIKLEESKPGLNIQMAYFNDINKAKEVISIHEVAKEFYAVKQMDFTKNEDEFKAFIQSKTQRDTVVIAEDCRRLIGQNKMDSIYSVYSGKRFSKINAYLNLQNDSTQIKLLPINALSPKNTGSIPMFEMKYSVED